MSKVIYIQIDGKFVKVSKPKRIHRDNFLIRYNNMDWSGFRHLEDCEKQFKELENRKDAKEDKFSVVEV